jgi:hypothetical protein
MRTRKRRCRSTVAQSQIVTTLATPPLLKWSLARRS